MTAGAALSRKSFDYRSEQSAGQRADAKREGL
jgi:hypothetical protein